MSIDDPLSSRRQGTIVIRDYVQCPRCPWHIDEPCRNCARYALAHHMESEHSQAEESA